MKKIITTIMTIIVIISISKAGEATSDSVVTNEIFIANVKTSINEIKNSIIDLTMELKENPINSPKWKDLATRLNEHLSILINYNNILALYIENQKLIKIVESMRERKRIEASEKRIIQTHN